MNRRPSYTKDFKLDRLTPEQKTYLASAGGT